MLIIGIILRRVSQCGRPLHPSFTKFCQYCFCSRTTVGFADCGWFCPTIRIWRKDIRCIQSILLLASSVTLFRTSSPLSSPTFSAIIFAPLCLAVSLSTPSFLSLNTPICSCTQLKTIQPELGIICPHHRALELASATRPEQHFRPQIELWAPS